MPSRDIDDDVVEYPFENAAEEKAYQKKRGRWVERNTAFSYQVEA
jgi:hypothetical protein